MSALTAFILREFPDIIKNQNEIRDTAISAIPAIPDTKGSENSNYSNYSRVVSSKFNFGSLQREADRVNEIARKEGRTDRFCRCGRLAECAWPLEGPRQMWRCVDCYPVKGRS